MYLLGHPHKLDLSLDCFVSKKETFQIDCLLTFQTTRWILIANKWLTLKIHPQAFTVTKQKIITQRGYEERLTSILIHSYIRFTTTWPTSKDCL